MRKKSNRNIQWAGIDTRNLGARAGTNNLRAVPNEIKQQFYKDFGKVIKEWWSFSNNWIKVTRNGLKADANNGAYSIEMKADLTVWVGGAKKQFKLDDSLYEIILWVDQQTRNKFAKENTMSLKSKLVRLAYENPSLRADLLPLITKSAKGDYKKGDKIPPKSVYGSKESYDEKLKDGKIFVVLPRESKNSDPFMMYLTDSSLKVLKVLGTHPTMRGAKAWLKSQKGKLASTRVAKLTVGQTWENDNLRVHRYRDAVKVWDLKHAGKRGKNVEIMHIYISDWKKPNPKRAYLDDLTNLIKDNSTYDQYKKLVISFLGKEGFSNVAGSRDSVVSFTTEKGVRIAPPNMGKIVINNRFVSAWFELGEFHIQDKTDQNNLPTMMERDRRSPPKLYKMVAGNKAMFEKMNYKEMRQFLIDYKINFRTYMGMD